ncbi:MAG: IclR family transcriptional regulator [Pseudomonadota bacterium]
MKNLSLSQSLIKGFSIIELLSSSPALGVTNISNQLQMNKSIVHRLLSTLVALNYVEKDPISRLYRLTTKLFEVGRTGSGFKDLEKATAPVMERLAREMGETIALAILDKGELVHIAKIESQQPLRADLPVGARLPPHCTALGKVLLAQLSSHELEAIFEGLDIVKMTSKTITDLDVFKKELSSVRKLGYAVNDEEYAMGIRCIGVPVKGADQEVLASLSVSGPSVRIQHKDIKRLSQILISAAEEVTQKLIRKMSGSGIE